MPAIVGKSVLDRKITLAGLVAQHLTDLGHSATVAENRTNSAGHTDRIVVESSLGLIHITALSSTNPNEALPHQGEEQKWIEEKSYIAIGWNDKAGRTLIFFVPANSILGRTDLTKDIMKNLSDRSLNKIIAFA